MKIAKKILTAVALCSIGIAVLMLIAAVLEFQILPKNVRWQLLLSLGATCLACGFAISSLSIMKKHKALSIISLALLGVCWILALIVFWSWFSVPVFVGKITIIISVTTVLFIIIVSANIKLGSRQKALQFITFGIVALIDIIIALAVFNVPVFNIPGFTQIFVVLCLVAFGLLCAVGILGKRAPETQETTKIEKQFVKIPLEEYQNMKAEIVKLKQELEQSKNN